MTAFFQKFIPITAVITTGYCAIAAVVVTMSLSIGESSCGDGVRMQTILCVRRGDGDEVLSSVMWRLKHLVI